MVHLTKEGMVVTEEPNVIYVYDTSVRPTALPIYEYEDGIKRVYRLKEGKIHVAAH